MKMLTLKLKPKTIFGIILAATGVVVILLTFVSNHLQKSQSVSAVISASTDRERRDYLEGFGWELGEECETKELTIPTEWNEIYTDYNEVQINQGFDLTEHKGQKVMLYTYTIKNYEGASEGIVADMLVFDGTLIGGDVCSTSAENGFLVGFSGE